MINHNQLGTVVDFSGHRLGNYRLVRLLGHGGFASVYLGEHLYLKRLSAIKILRTVLTEKEKNRFLEEARLLGNLSHPHIVRVLEFAIAQRWTMTQSGRIKENIPFLVMDYASGGNLRALYPTGACLPLPTVTSHIKQAAAALQHAHDQNIIHRDIKPENLLINERQEVMLSDFGLALFAPSPELISLQGMAGTLHYAAPEQLQGRPSFASDQYSLGIVAYEWLCGSRPFDGEDVEIIVHHVSSPPPPLRSKNPSIPQAVEDVVLKALAKDPQQRHSTIQTFAQALEQANQAPQFPPITRKLSAITRKAPIVEVSPAKKDLTALHHLSVNADPASPNRGTSLSGTAADLEHKHLAQIATSMHRNRQRMLQKVRAFWVNGVLKQSLHGASFITLGLDERPDVVTNPWPTTLHKSEQQTRSLAPGTSITEIYDQAGGELLLLGEAGSGKTTLLLELARHLLERAEKSDSAPIPVVFLLSSWAEKQLPLDQWLIEELSSKYQVPRPLGEIWVRTEMLLPLLDGLDEVPANARPACIVAINAYKKEHGLSPLVVCSRLTEYLLFTSRMHLRGAVVVRPLTMKQIEGYLHSAGTKFDIIYQMLCEDLMLQRLVTTPLMLNIITLAYQDKSPEDLLVMYSSLGRYQRILSTYVEQMLHRHSTTAPYRPQKLIDWLSYLARELQQHGQRVFYIEQLQPGWINKKVWLQVYMWLAVLLPGVLIGMLAGTLSNDLFFHVGMVNSVFIDGLYGAFMGFLLSIRGTVRESSEWQSAEQSDNQPPSRTGTHILTALFIGLLSCLCLGFTKGWTDGFINGAFLAAISLPLSTFFEKRRKRQLSGETEEKPLMRFSYKHLRNGILVGLVCGLSSVLTTIITQGLFNQSFLYLLSLLLRDSLRDSLIGVLISTLLVNNDGTIHRAEIIVWSWKRFLRKLASPTSAITGMFIGLLIGVSYGLKQASQANWSNVLSAGLSDGLFLALGYYLVAALFHGISSHNLDNQRRYRSNEGIRRSLYYGFFSSVIGFFASALSYVLSNALSSAMNHEIAGMSAGGKGYLAWSWDTFTTGFQYGLSIDFVNALLLGVVGSLLTGLLLGGLASLQHGILRLILWVTGVLPLKLARFLDYAADSALLHRVGGGYIFIHRLLLEYFASLDDRRTRDNKQTGKQASDDTQTSEDKVHTEEYTSFDSEHLARLP
ncbi:MAG TPA: protein kinase [Ktedonobacteraceae bacterium]|nr:protein kinase [Ktedonobacteraceae bacterium]